MNIVKLEIKILSNHLAMQTLKNIKILKKNLFFSRS